MVPIDLAAALAKAQETRGRRIAGIVAKLKVP
jgi:hypothetical protein